MLQFSVIHGLGLASGSDVLLKGQGLWEERKVLMPGTRSQPEVPLAVNVLALWFCVPARMGQRVQYSGCTMIPSNSCLLLFMHRKPLGESWDHVRGVGCVEDVSNSCSFPLQRLFQQ